MFDPTKTGLAIFLGPREADILEILWSRGPLSGKDIRFELRLKKKLAPTTVLTVLTRLVNKNLVSRQRQGKVYLYQANGARADFVTARIGEIVRALRDSFPKEYQQAGKATARKKTEK